MYNLIRNVLHQIFHFVIFTVAMNMNMKYFPDYKKRTRTFQNYFMSVSKFESLIILNSLAFEITYISLISSGFVKVEKKQTSDIFGVIHEKKHNKKIMQNTAQIKFANMLMMIVRSQQCVK